jgi:hypothetical protein
VIKNKPRYKPRVFEGSTIQPDEIERTRIDAVTDSMRQLIEDLWPELVHKLGSRRRSARREPLRLLAPRIAVAAHVRLNSLGTVCRGHLV